MGLLTILRKQKLKSHELRILLLGLDNAGKSTIVKAWLKDDVKDVTPTLGFSIKSLELNGFILNIWDVGGQSSLRPFWRNYYEKTDVLVWVVDSGALDRLDDCRREFQQVLDEDQLLGAGILIIANKIDLCGADVVKKISDALEVDKIVGHKVKIMPCSAITGVNVENSLNWIVNEVKERLYILD